jgi:hypothetical protein
MIPYSYVHPLRNPYEIAKSKGPPGRAAEEGFERSLRYLERGDHLDPAKQIVPFYSIVSIDWR